MYVIFKKESKNTEYGLKILSFVGGTLKEFKSIEEEICDFIEDVSTISYLEEEKIYVYESDSEEIFTLIPIKEHTSYNCEVLMYNENLYTLNEW